ncbi:MULTISPECIES: hypothetical protein [Halorussus]|uniref:DUF7344 domain-containing protein n=1 Tax=Halorussus TaxID=1070314 RepID=UPI000E2185D9|nr:MULTISPECIES: hypothetical protein [Halorussus]NHN61441.1 hypothetical protein [Halorussus sp. JP-T4]
MTSPDPADDRASDRVDAHLGLLAAPTCRYALYYFERAPDAAASPTDIADWAAATDGLAPDVSRDRLAVRLHHAALPKLDRSGVVTYDAAARAAEYCAGSELESLVELAAEREGA